MEEKYVFTKTQLAIFVRDNADAFDGEIEFPEPINQDIKYTKEDMLKFKRDTELLSTSEFTNSCSGLKESEIEEKWFELHKKQI